MSKRMQELPIGYRNSLLPVERRQHQLGIELQPDAAISKTVLARP